MVKFRWFALCTVVAALAVGGLSLPTGSSLWAAQDDGPRDKASVYVYPKKLTPTDKLSFGPSDQQSKTIPIKGETTLIYVDLAPDARFAHATQCILISTDGAQVINGSWWLVLNGKPLFRDGKNYKVDFPIGVLGK